MAQRIDGGGGGSTDDSSDDRSSASPSGTQRPPTRRELDRMAAEQSATGGTTAPTRGQTNRPTGRSDSGGGSDGGGGGGDSSGGGTMNGGSSGTGGDTSPPGTQTPPGGDAPDPRRRRRRDPGSSPSPPGQQTPPGGSRPEDRRQRRDRADEAGGGLADSVPVWAATEASQFRSRVARESDRYDFDDIRVSYEDGELQAEIAESARRREAREAVASESEHLDPSDLTVTFDEEGQADVTATDRAQATLENEREREFREQVAEEHGVSPGEVEIQRENDQLVAELSDTARESIAARELGVAPDDVEVVTERTDDWTTGQATTEGVAVTAGRGTTTPTETFEGQARERIRLTDEGLREYTAEQSEEIAGIGTVEVVRTPTGERRVQYTEEEAERRQREAAGPIADVTAEYPIIDPALDRAGEAFEPVAEAGASVSFWPSRTVASVGEEVGVPGAAAASDRLTSLERGTAEAFNVPRAGQDLAAVGEAVAYASGVPAGTPDDPVERLKTVGAAGEFVGRRAVDAAVENPYRTAGAIGGGALVGTAAWRGAVAGVRGARSIRSGSVATEGTTVTGRVGDTVSSAADRTPVSVVRDPDAPLVEVTPEAAAAARALPTAPVRVARSSAARARMAARRVRRDLDYADPITDARATARVAVGRAADRVSLAARRIRRDREFVDPVTDARMVVRSGADSLSRSVGGGARRAPGYAAERIRQTARRARRTRREGIDAMELGAAARRGRAQLALQRAYDASAGRVDDARAWTAETASRATELPEDSPLRGEIAPTSVNLRQFESVRRPDTDLGRPLQAELDAPSIGEAVRGTAAAALPSRPAGLGLSDLTIRIGSRPPRLPGYDLGDLDEGILPRAEFSDADEVPISPRSDTARRFRDMGDTGDARQMAQQRARSRAADEVAEAGIGREFDLRGPMATGAFAGLSAGVQGLDRETALASAFDTAYAGELDDVSAAEAAMQDEAPQVMIGQRPMPISDLGVGDRTATTPMADVTTRTYLDTTTTRRPTTTTRRPRVPVPTLPDFGGPEDASAVETAFDESRWDTGIAPASEIVDDDVGGVERAEREYEEDEWWY